MRQFLLQNRDLIFSIEELRKKLNQLEQSGEETLAAINDLSEDTRRELDDIYVALAEMANKKRELNKPNRIGFVKDE
jgi:DNA-binding transcriptional MerR regulator